MHSSQNTPNVHLDRNEGEWVLVLERHLAHSCEEVWGALTEAGKIPKWGPFEPDRDLTETGTVRLKAVNVPEADEMQGNVLEVAAPRRLAFQWGTDVLQWGLRREGEHTVLTLRHRFAERKMAPSYAAGWHLCLEGLTGVLAGQPTPSMAGKKAFDYGWHDLYARYAEQFGVDKE